MASALVCSINGCKRAVTGLCHHCNQNVCFKHFGEHQVQINNELLPLADRLNELKMKLQTKDNQNETLAMLKMWRDKKHNEIDEEYDRKVQEFNAKILKQDGQVSEIIVKIEGLVNEGEASYEQVKQLKREIESMENQVNQLMRNEQIQIPSENAATESDLVNTYMQFGHQKVLIKGRVFCRGRDLYALESAVSLKGYDGLCPLCGIAHMPLQPNRGFYLSGESLHKHLKSKMNN